MYSALEIRDIHSSIPVEHVVGEYSLIDKENPRKDVTKMIQLYPRWNSAKLSLEEIGNLVWYFDSSDPLHISNILTDSGTKRRVKDVAARYLELEPQGSLSKWTNSQKIEDMIKSLRNGEKFPPIIIIPGEKYPESPSSSFIDGVHRALSMMVYSIIDESVMEFYIDAFVGQKAPLINRIAGKFLQKVGKHRVE